MKEVRRVDYQTVKPFCLGIHYARRMPCVQFAFGLYEDNELIGVVTFGQPASPSLCKGVAGENNRGNVLELNRLVFLPERNGDNNASMLVSKALKMLPAHTFVVSYADYGGWGHVGYIYQATNFLYTGMTKPRTDKFAGGGIVGTMRRTKSEDRRELQNVDMCILWGTKKNVGKCLKNYATRFCLNIQKGRRAITTQTTRFRWSAPTWR